MTESICKNQLQIYYDPEHDLFFSDKTSLLYDNEVKPVSICMRICLRCNLICRYCISESNPEHKNDADYIDIMRTIEPLGPLRIVWSGGEPTLSDTLYSNLKYSITKGFFNIVTTNMTIDDPLSEFAGLFHYNVSIYGINKEEYKAHTRKDYFHRFIKNFDKLFSKNHQVCANIVLNRNWYQYLPRYIDWLKEYPIKKLLLTNLSMTGRSNDSMKPAGKKELRKVKEFLLSIKPNFPIIYPSENSLNASKRGYILIDRIFDNNSFATINGERIHNRNELVDYLHGLGPPNFHLFTIQNYILPNNFKTNSNFNKRLILICR